MNFLKYNLLTALSLSLLTFSACEKDEETTTEPHNHDSHKHGTLALEINQTFGMAPFALNEVYDNDSLKIKFTDARFFLSGFSHEGHHDGMTQAYETVVLVSPDQSSYTIGEVAEGHVMTLNYNIGLDSITNHQDPTLADAPLNDQTMHWSWNPAAGYKFTRFEGIYDGNDDGVIDTLDNNYTFTFHLATDALLTSDSKMVHGDISEGETLTVTLNVDYSKLFNGIDLTKDNSGHGGAPINATLIQNMKEFVIN